MAIATQQLPGKQTLGNVSQAHTDLLIAKVVKNLNQQVYRVVLLLSDVKGIQFVPRF